MENQKMTIYLSIPRSEVVRLDRIRERIGGTRAEVIRNVLSKYSPVYEVEIKNRGLQPEQPPQAVQV